MEKNIVKQINKLSAKCYLFMYDVVGNHNDKAIYRERFISGLINRNLKGIGIPEGIQNEALSLCDTQDKINLFTAFLFIDRTGRTLDEIGMDAGLTCQEIELLREGKL